MQRPNKTGPKGPWKLALTMENAAKARKIEAEAIRRAKGLAMRREFMTGFGMETALEDALTEMAVFAVGVATDQEELAASVLEEAAK
jgi:hypothetical protein